MPLCYTGYCMAWQTRKIMGALAFGVMSFILRATAQETIYSADSLMATLENRSKVPLKGTQITFRDFVKESESTKVTFKSSLNNRVICKLSASTEDYKTPPLVGSEITVIGKFRGRGLLGNVTLDNCVVAPAADSEPSANLPQDAASTPADAPSEESVTEAASLSVPPEDITNDFAPIQSARPTKPRIRREKQKAAPSRLLQQNQRIKSGPDFPRAVPYGFYALLLIGGAVGYWILSKLLTSIVGSMRSSRYEASSNAAEVRKAALELLLLKSSKKK